MHAWEESNQAYLMGALAEVHAALAAYVSVSANQAGAADHAAAPAPVQTAAASLMDPPAALEALCGSFGLSAFERKILLMCAGVELNSQFASLCRMASKDLRHALPTFSLALAMFEEAHWSALLPSRPLRRWRLIEVVPGETLTMSALRIDERVLHHLTGTSGIDERLRGFVEPARKPGALPPSHQALAAQIANHWRSAEHRSERAVLQLCGVDAAAKHSLGAVACGMLDIKLSVVRSGLLPRGAPELDLFIQLCEREAALNPGALLLECDDTEPTDAAGEAAIDRFIETIRCPLLISVLEPRRSARCLVVTVPVLRPTSAEQRQLWREALGPAASTLNGCVEKLVSQFSLSPGNIHAAASSVDLMTLESAEDPAAGLWDACRVQARPRMEGLAQRIEAAAVWDDLVLPERQKQLLRQITIHVRQRSKIYQSWGFDTKGSRGMGVSALFAGPSGTGKTMASEVLANELRLDLYRIDLSRVVSKYIGETEKNLRRVFDAAEDGAAILLFDEADALFGRRSEVKDSHDRYANIEVSYLLQRMETYRGLAILTTNRRDALDHAFMRRIRFAVEFPFPEVPQRMEIWRRVFPQQTPTEGLRIDRLARLNAAGGNIQNIALSAAFIAADAAEPVRMAHLLSAARSEFAKLERPLTDAETAGWV